MDFVAFLGQDTETWGQITGLINNGNWEKIILIKNKGAPEYPRPPKAEIITIDSSKKLLDLKQDIMNKLRGKFKEFEVSISIASGNGKEHMALISALLSLPLGIRLVAFTKNGVERIN